MRNKKKQSEKFALKCIEKHEMIECELEEYIYREKTILETINFPFIVQLERHFSDQYHMYFLLEYIQGGDLFELINNQGIFSDHEARFYIACFILALEYLHGKGICYRDLKPENSVIDDKGFLRLIDLGAAKFLTDDSGCRTFTVIGSPHYMAP